MNREVHVRFWESLGVRFPWATQLVGGAAAAWRIHDFDSVVPEDYLN